MEIPKKSRLTSEISNAISNLDPARRPGLLQSNGSFTRNPEKNKSRPSRNSFLPGLLSLALTLCHSVAIEELVTLLVCESRRIQVVWDSYRVDVVLYALLRERFLSSSKTSRSSLLCLLPPKSILLNNSFSYFHSLLTILLPTQYRRHTKHNDTKFNNDLQTVVLVSIADGSVDDDGLSSDVVAGIDEDEFSSAVSGVVWRIIIISIDSIVPGRPGSREWRYPCGKHRRRVGTHAL